MGVAMRTRVVITGIGVVTPIGIGRSAFWEGLLAGRSGVGPITLFDASDLPCRIAAEVKDFQPDRFFDRKQLRLVSRVAQFGVASSLLCLEDAGWKNGPGAERLGVVAGISNSAQDAAEAVSDIMHEHGYRRLVPYFLTKAFPHATASETGLRTGFQSRVLTIATACTAGLNAIARAADEIRNERLDAVLVPSTDATITRNTVACFCRAGLVSLNNGDPAHASRPFDARRDGGILGEGAAALLIEGSEHARRRQARVYAEVLGFGSSGTGYGPEPATSTPKGMAAAMREAMASANCGPTQLQYIGCHGVSDPHLDAWETQAMKLALGDSAYRVPMSSAKAQIGIPQNAAGMLQLVAAVQAVVHGVLPATMNYEVPDPECDLDYVPNTPRHNEVTRAMVLAHGFSGSDAAVVVGRACLP
jgi:3-oxoacyl-[acyl-carrier-protein] synthase II